MSLTPVINRLRQPRWYYLSQDEAIAYICAQLQKKDVYGTGLIKDLLGQSPTLRISDTILYGALQQLAAEGVVETYYSPVDGRGRPRTMYKVIDNNQEVKALASTWINIAS